MKENRPDKVSYIEKNTSNINCHRASISKMTNRNFILTLLLMFYQETVWTMDISRSVLLCFEKLTGNDGGWCNSTIMLCNAGIAQNITIGVTFSHNLNGIQCAEFCGMKHKPIFNNTYNLLDNCLRMECNLTDFMIPSDPGGNGKDSGFVNVTYSCTDNTEIAEEADNITTSTPLTILTSTNSQVTITTTRTLSTTTLTSASIISGRTTILSEASTGRGSTHMINTTPIKTSTASARRGSTSKGDSTTPIGSSTTPVENKTTPTVESTTQIGKSTTLIGHSTEATSPPNELTVAQIRTDDPFTAAIAVSVVIPVIIAVVVVAVMMYRRGKCKLPFFKCTERCDNHSPGMTDTYAMSSTANADPTYDFSRDVDVILCDVDYSEINKVRKETDSEYNHVNLKMKQAVLDPTYNHIGHFNSSSGDTEQTYNIVGDKTSQKTDSSTLQPDMYSHIGAMAKPASGHLVEDSYAHINGVIKNTSTSYERKHYDIAVFQSNCGPTEGVGNQDREMKSSKEKTFIVVEPSNVDSNNEALTLTLY